MIQHLTKRFAVLIGLAAALSACAPAREPLELNLGTPTTESTPAADQGTPMPTRPAYDPGTLVEYIAQTGDTLPSLASRFNTSIAEIRAANPIIPEDVTTLPPGFPMQIPIYYRAFWGTPYRALPDGLFVNGQAQRDFDAATFLADQSGWLQDYRESAARETLSTAQIVDLVATNFSISPRLLLALVEYHSGGLSQPELDPSLRLYPLGYESLSHRGLYLQLVWAANTLNNAFYGWRTGKLIEFEDPEGNIFRPDPWQTASSVALQYLYSQTLSSKQEFEQAIGPEGLAQSYAQFFGDPWTQNSDHIPGSLLQPELRLPITPGEAWTFTGGPHTGWGQGEPWAALDFAPGVERRGCVDTDAWATAVADGVVVRTGEGILVLDLDGDSDERTGWAIFYLHLASKGKMALGTQVAAGQPVGHPSCEGGTTTGTHVHVARKYNGEWIPAAGALPFVMEDWVPQDGIRVYLGSLVQPGRQITACTCSDASSVIVSIAEPVDFPTPAGEASLEGSEK